MPMTTIILVAGPFLAEICRLVLLMHIVLACFYESFYLFSCS